VKEGDKVVAGQPLATVEAMKMENILRAHHGGIGQGGERRSRPEPRRRRR
jgi:acetyl/propionyl-CoA carboxylase alpha subunit